MSALQSADTELLRRPLYGFLTVAGGPDPAQPRPVWFELTDEGVIQLFSTPDTVKVRRLRRDARASIVVTAPVGEREHWVSVAGPVTVVSDGATALAGRLAARYWNLDDPERARDLAAMQSTELVRIVVHAEKVSRYLME